ncbi:MAG: hypothetical protein KGI27_14255 [Thaumarchaeota archaeon]|nr:hypothetical protein [Nitrososphaerota archaeon]
MREKNWSYVAGIFDGEGSIHAHHYQVKSNTTIDPDKRYVARQVKITIVGTDIRLMKWLLGNFGGKFYDRAKRTASGRHAYYWRPKGKKNTENFLLGILPYLIMKKEQAKLALEFIRLEGVCPEEREAILQKISALNHADVSVETNTLDSEQSEMRESDLIGDYESAPLVTMAA